MFPRYLRFMLLMSATLEDGSTAFVQKPTFRLRPPTTTTASNSKLEMTVTSNITSTGSPSQYPDNFIPPEDMDNQMKMMKIKHRIAQTKRRMPTYDQNGPIATITTTESFLDVLQKSPPNGLVVIKYHAKFCKVCARVMIKYKKLADRLSATKTSVPISFADVELTANKDLCSTLGVKKFPFVQIYRNMECVASFGTGPAHNFKKVVDDSISDKLKMTDEDWDRFRYEYEKEILGGLIKIDQLALNVALNLDTCEEDGYMGNDLLP